jgi:hypothetical protein
MATKAQYHTNRFKTTSISLFKNYLTTFAGHRLNTDKLFFLQAITARSSPH